MEKFKILFVINFFSFGIYAQLPVTDVAANTNIIIANTIAAKDLAEAFMQGKTLVDTYKAVADGVEIYNKISTKIRYGIMVKNIITDQLQIVDLAGKTLKNISNSNTPKNTLYEVNNKINYILRGTTSNVDLISALLKEAEIKTDDGQRISLLNKIQEDNEKKQAELTQINDYYKQKAALNSFYDNMAEQKKASKSIPKTKL